MSPTHWMVTVGGGVDGGLPPDATAAAGSASDPSSTAIIRCTRFPMARSVCQARARRGASAAVIRVMDTSSPVAVSGAPAARARVRALDRLHPPNCIVEGVVVVIAYTLLGALLYQTPLAGHANSLAAGLGLPDNDAFVWMLAWPEHAIASGLGLFHTNIVFVPEGYNLAHATPMFTFGVILAPLTAVAGPL